MTPVLSKPVMIVLEGKSRQLLLGSVCLLDLSLQELLVTLYSSGVQLQVATQIRVVGV
jgi:hypothetical protein